MPRLALQPTNARTQCANNVPLRAQGHLRALLPEPHRKERKPRQFLSRQTKLDPPPLDRRHGQRPAQFEPAEREAEAREAETPEREDDADVSNRLDSLYHCQRIQILESPWWSLASLVIVLSEGIGNWRARKGRKRYPKLPGQ